MTGITYFVALPFDVADGSFVVGEPIECLSPAAAIERDEFSLLRRPDRSAKREVEGPSFHDKPRIVERRSLRYASLRSAPVGTTEST